MRIMRRDLLTEVQYRAVMGWDLRFAEHAALMDREFAEKHRPPRRTLADWGSFGMIPCLQGVERSIQATLRDHDEACETVDAALIGTMAVVIIGALMALAMYSTS